MALYRCLTRQGGTRSAAGRRRSSAGPPGSVDERLRTSDPHIHAVGDAVEKVDGLTAETTLVPLANTANRQGRVLADVLTGRPGEDRPVLGTAIVGVFGLQVASTGWNEKRLRAVDLADLELAYAPAFGSAKDPVNMLGYVDQNTLTGVTPTVQWHELADAMAAGASLIDVRGPAEFAAGAIPGAVNIPVDELRDRLDELPEGALIVHCAVGVRGHIAAWILAEHGRAVRNLDGGYRTWAAGVASQAG